MKKQILLLILSVFSTAFIFALDADAILGRYHLPNQLDIEIFKLEGKYFGKIVGLDGFDGGQQLDINNPEKALRTEPLLGKTIINNLEYDSSVNQWVDGSMYGPEKGLLFSLKITQIREYEIEVIGSKYLFWKKMTWEKL